MEALAILILLALGGWAVYAVRSAKRKKGGCGCGCSGCNGCERKNERPAGAGGQRNIWNASRKQAIDCFREVLV